MNKKRIVNYFIIILLLATFCRLYHLSDQPLWIDEGYTLNEMQGTFDEMQDKVMKVESQPPLYFIMMYQWVQWFGTSEFSLRFPSVLFGILSCIFLCFIGKKLYDHKAGLISMLLMAVSMIPIMLSQEARSYSMFICLTLMSFLFFLYVINERNILYSSFYYFSTILLILTHYFSIIVLLLQLFIYISFKDTYPKNKFVSMWLVLSGLWIALLFIMKSQVIRTIDILKMMFEVRFNLPFLSAQLLLIILAFLVLFFLILYLQVEYKILQRFKFIFGVNFFLLFFLLFFVSNIFLIPFLITPVFFIRYSSFLYPFILLYMGIMISRVKNASIVVVFLTLLLGGLLFPIYYNVSERKEQWDDVAYTIAQNETSKDIILLVDDDFKSLLRYYYKGLSIVAADSTGNQTANNNMWNSFNMLANQYNNIWFVSSHDYQTKNFWYNQLNINHSLIFNQSFVGINLYKFEVKK